MYLTENSNQILSWGQQNSKFEIWPLDLINKNSGEQEKESIIRVMVG